MWIYIDYLIGLLFVEFVVKIVLGYIEFDDKLLEFDGKYLIISFNNVLEEDFEEENSGEIVVEFRFIGGE